MWFGFVTVSGLFLFAIIPWANAHSNTTNGQVVFKQLPVTVNQIPSGTYAQVIQKRFNCTSEDVPVVRLTETNTQKTEPEVVAKVETKSSANTVQKAPVQTASVQKTQKALVQTASVPTPKVSRGSSDKSTLISNALSLQGIPYVFGGTNRKGFDCSGFTQYVFGGSKISLPRTAAEQYNIGTPVSRQQLQPGDLVFFTTYKSGASHVGIYIGGGNFIHASSSGVRITSLDNSYYKTRYLGARRV
jgi:Cell wall-associated hydrolases (invasion-associated proteins)